MSLDADLRRRLETVGLDPDAFGDPATAWRRLHDLYGRRATLVDRYDLEAARRGVAPYELETKLRARLTIEVLRTHDPEFELVSGSDRGRRDPIEVVPYDPVWPTRFEEWRHCLRSSLGAVAVRVEHIGSTAVPGMAAKPVIDIQVSVTDPEEEDSYVPAIESVGVALRSREGEGHRYFRPAGDEERTVQIHVCRVGSDWERTHLLFRDYLRAEEAVRRKYADLKRQLARRYRDDRIAYNEGKTGFILDAMAEASVWAGHTGWRLPGDSGD